MGDLIVQYGGHFGFVASLLVGLIAAVVAYVAIRTQRDIARKRATLDFFLKTEADPALHELWKKYEVGLSVLGCHGAAGFQKAHKEHYENIRHYLNLLELLACGVFDKVLDAKIAEKYFGPTVSGGYFKTRELIHVIIQDYDSEYTYCDFVRLAKKWHASASKTRR